MAGAGAWAALRTFVSNAIAGTLIGLTVSDRYCYLVRIDGPSMHPIFEDRAGQYALVKRPGLARYDFSRGDVVTFMLPADHRSWVVQRLIGLPGDWISVPETAEFHKIPEGHCWVEGDNRSASWDSRHYGPVPLGLVQGRVTHVVWPPHKMGQVEKDGPSREKDARRKGHAAAIFVVSLPWPLGLLYCFPTVVHVT
ncbi:unnamed protein product [Alopecurus aequalis]